MALDADEKGNMTVEGAQEEQETQGKRQVQNALDLALR